MGIPISSQTEWTIAFFNIPRYSYPPRGGEDYLPDRHGEESIKLTIKSLLEVDQTGAKNIEISVLDGYNKITVGVFPSGPR